MAKGPICGDSFVARRDRHHILSLDEACGGDKPKSLFGILGGEKSVLKETSKTITGKQGSRNV